jgi:hypothetical protein
VADKTPSPCHLEGLGDSEPEVKALVFTEPH